MISARIRASAVAAAVAASAAVLYRFSPAEHSFYPRCPFFLLTGHLCPGCGATRALFELLHGRVAAAFGLNPVVTFLVPAALAYLAAVYGTALRDNRLEWPQLPRWTWQVALAAVLALGVARGFFEPSL